MRPVCAAAASTTRATSALRATSATTAVARGTPGEAADSSASATSAMTTVAPSSAKRFAMARPMPRAAPVTTATRPSSLCMRELRFSR